MSLVLDSLEIKNFRAFKHLRIEKLGRVNLIVGKNNVGKSSALEALWIYANHAAAHVIVPMLVARNEVNDYKDINVEPNASVVRDRILAMRYLFHGREDIRSSVSAIEIGPLYAESNKIVISVNLATPADENNGETQKPFSHQGKSIIAGKSDVPGIVVDIGQRFRAYYALDQGKSSTLYLTASPIYFSMIKTTFVEASGLNTREVASLWDKVALSDSEEDVLSALRIIAPELIALNLVGDESKSGERIAKVRVADVDGPISLRSMGEGMNRMFGIALALVNAKDGMLLIDEVDTGLHYSVLPDLWKLIFEVAHRLNVQVFATSHSWDCIEAFQQAADASKDEEGILIRLETQDGEVVPVTFDERMLNIATREHIEVR